MGSSRQCQIFYLLRSKRRLRLSHICRDLRVLFDYAGIKLGEVEADAKWDGLKGYVTNTQLPADEIIANYRHLWQIERAFRISKTDLLIRPIHHYLKPRIEAHICIAFVAYTIYKELERILRKAGVAMSAGRAAELTHTIYELEYSLPGSGEKKRQLLQMDQDQRLLYDLIRDSMPETG